MSLSSERVILANGRTIVRRMSDADLEQRERDIARWERGRPQRERHQAAFKARAKLTSEMLARAQRGEAAAVAERDRLLDIIDADRPGDTS